MNPLSTARIHFFVIAFLASIWSGGTVASTKGQEQTPIDSSTRLKEELVKRAPLAWRRFREGSLENQSQHISKRLTYGIETKQQSSETLVNQIQYAKGPVRFLKVESRRESVAYTSVAATNSRYGFQVERQEAMDWRLSGLEMLDSPTQPFHPDILTLHRSGRVKQPTEVIGMSLSVDERLSIIGQPIESFFERMQPSITSVQERTDPKLGSVVTVLIRKEYESRGNPLFIEGKIEFLPENKWLMLSYEYTSMKNSKDELGEIRSTEVFTSSYETDATSQLTSTLRTNRRPSGGFSIESLQYRQLTDKEISECKRECYLSPFGLPEPPGTVWGLPILAYLLISSGVGVVAALLWVSVRQRK